LTLDYDQATSIGLAVFVASDIDDLFEKMGYENPVLPTVELSWSEKLAGFLVKPAVAGALMLIAMAAFYVEFKTPGVGVPLALGLLAISLFFWGSLLADLSSYWELALFILGLILLTAEVFIIPGFGIAGILGLLFVIASLLLSMGELPATESVFEPINIDVMRVPLYTLTGVIVAALPMFWILTVLLPKTPMFSSLITDPNRTDTAAAEDAIRNAPKKYLGRAGEALSDLRPAGHALLDGKRVVVVTQGEYIAKGSIVRVIDEQGNEIVVTLEQGRG
jgi:membrane-bound serine protease (ClpP class)